MVSEAQNPGEDGGTAEAAVPPADAHFARLSQVEIINYKAIDRLVLDIPAPRMPHDPDVFVVGSKNGAGKTSLLEACALAQLNRSDQPRLGAMFRYLRDVNEEVIELSREPGKPFAIEARHGIRGESSLEWAAAFFGPNPVNRMLFPQLVLLGDDAEFTQQFLGRSPNILLHHDLLYFHSYRKVAEGSIRTQEMLSRQRPAGASVVKLKAVRLLLASSGLVEGIETHDAERRLEQLNQLLSSFTGGRIDKKLRPVAKAQLDLRIVTPRGTTFSFDALSSGQKEIVTTLFLVWNETLAHPALVLIDEPELHLNAEWQREFLRHLLELAPHNQYILATHSEDIFGSVAQDRRVLLEASRG